MMHILKNTSWKRQSFFAGLVLLALVSFTAVSVAQAAPAPCSGIGASADDALLQLSLKDNRSKFHEGEIITLQLAFTSRTKGKYHLDSHSTAPTGRLTRESFCLEPAAGSDPLADYLAAGFAATDAGVGGNTVLKKNPFRLDLDLNEWKSLPPGNYHLLVETQRVSQVNGSEQIPVIVRSNPVQFQVVAAAPSWQAAQLAAAVKALDSGSSEEARRAAHVLRFLGTEAATRELANRYWGVTRQPNGSDLMLGLVGSPHRDVAIQQMRDAISDPQHPITRDFLKTLAMLETISEPQFKSEITAAQTTDQLQQAQQNAAASMDKLVTQHLTELSSAAPQKTGNALKVTMETLKQPQSQAAVR